MAAQGGSARALVIVGTGLAAVRAAEGARSAGWTGRIELIGEEHHQPYDRPPLSKDFLATDAEAAFPALRSDEAWAAVDATVRTGTAAIGLDTGRHVLSTTDGEVRYDALVIATGSRPREIPEMRRQPGVHKLHRYDDAVAIRAALPRARRLLVIGAGFIGSEIASAARQHGVEVTIVDAAPQPLARAIGPLAASRLTDLHRAAGVRLVLGSGVTLADDASTAPADGVTVRLDRGELLTADMVIVGIGVTPATAWLRDSGLLLDAASGGVVCDDRMQTAAADVWAAGDVAVVGDGRPGGHWTAAAEQGFVAGANAVGDDGTVVGVPFAWSTWHGHRIQTVGDTRRGAEIDRGGGLVEYQDGEVVVGAVGIDRPGDIARLRRALLAIKKGRPVGSHQGQAPNASW
ncbi:FAD-dependent oxidoreductase [Gordonia sp. CPCC 205515]|uniref:NAD(P)/FAD-dependent oxidoreductase n=1 Tax=Gordonia sp. CPCC 205515 TaxID=3140791 RepID=UPI003AF35A9B